MYNIIVFIKSAAKPTAFLVESWLVDSGTLTLYFKDRSQLVYADGQWRQLHAIEAKEELNEEVPETLESA